MPPTPASKLAAKPKSAKGQQSRKKLKAAALAMLEQKDYRSLRIADVTSEAGMATGLFYHYFKDLKALVIEVLTDYVAIIYDAEKMEQGIDKGDWYQRIYVYHLKVAKSYAEKPGLMRSLLQVADDDAEFSELLRKNFVDQLLWLVKLMPNLFPQAKQTEQQALAVVYTLAASAEVMLRDIYVNQVPELVSQKMSVEEVAELLSVMFYRGLFLQNPPQEKLNFAKHVQEMVR